jgi:hypothetical protein
VFATRKPSPEPIHASILSEILSDPALQEQNTSAWSELRAISKERDSNIFNQSLLVFGNRQEDAGNEALAARVYRALQTGAPQGSEVAQRAHSRLSALTGQGGSFGDQFEVSLRHFREQAPVAVGTMLPGFLAFKTVQLGMWNGLLNRATSSFLTRGVGAEAFAGLLALLAEGPVMTATQHALGQEGASWRSDLLANYRMMLGLRAAGGAVSLLGRVPGAPQGIWRSVAHQVGTLGGLTLAQGGDLTWSQTFQTLGYFHLTASLTGGFFGSPFAAREAALRQASARPAAAAPVSWRNDALPSEAALGTGGAVKVLSKPQDPGEIYRVHMASARDYALSKRYEGHPLFQNAGGMRTKVEQLEESAAVKAGEHLQLVAGLYAASREGGQLNSTDAKRLYQETLSEIVQQYNASARPRLSSAELRGMTEQLPPSFHRDSQNWERLWLAYGMIVTHFGEISPKTLPTEIQGIVRDLLSQNDRTTGINKVDPAAISQLAKKIQPFPGSQVQPPGADWILNLFGLLAEYHPDAKIQKLAQGASTPLSFPTPIPPPARATTPEFRGRSHPTPALSAGTEASRSPASNSIAPAKEEPDVIVERVMHLVRALASAGTVFLVGNEQHYAVAKRGSAQSQLTWLSTVTQLLSSDELVQLLGRLELSLEEMVKSITLPDATAEKAGISRESTMGVIEKILFLQGSFQGTTNTEKSRAFFAAMGRQTEQLRNDM